MDANELYDPEFRELIKSKNPTIIIPVGSLEQHGAHLPITTDSDIVTEIASRLAKKDNVNNFLKKCNQWMAFVYLAKEDIKIDWIKVQEK